MTMNNLIIAFCACLTVAFAQSNCEWLLGRDCTQYGTAPCCGTNGFTYDNRCYISQAACKDPNLTILHDGKCFPSEVSTTPAPTVENGEQAIVDFFCTALSKDPCGDVSQPVCGSDGRTYLNYCEFDKAKCTHRELQVTNFGACSTK